MEVGQEQGDRQRFCHVLWFRKWTVPEVEVLKCWVDQSPGRIRTSRVMWKEPSSIEIENLSFGRLIWMSKDNIWCLVFQISLSKWCREVKSRDSSVRLILTNLWEQFYLGWELNWTGLTYRFVSLTSNSVFLPRNTNMYWWTLILNSSQGDLHLFVWVGGLISKKHLRQCTWVLSPDRDTGCEVYREVVLWWNHQTTAKVENFVISGLLLSPNSVLTFLFVFLI